MEVRRPYEKEGKEEIKQEGKDLKRKKKKKKKKKREKKKEIDNYYLRSVKHDG